MKGGQPRRDALHRANYTDGRTEVFHIDGFEDETNGWPREGDVGLQVAWAAALTENPTEKYDSALDLATWLATLPAVDRALLADRLAGMSLQKVADRAESRSRRRSSGFAASGNGSRPMPGSGSPRRSASRAAAP